MKQLLQACRDNFGPAPRTMDAAQADAFRVRLRGGLEAMQREENDAMLRILDDQHLLRERGTVYWGNFIQANQVLFQPGNAHTCPANLVFSTEPFFDDKPHLLGQLARGLGGMKGREPADPSLADFVHVITDERARILCRELPRPYCRGHLAYFATVYVEPRQLPGRYLAHFFAPVVACPEETPAVMLLPCSYWPRALAARWNPRPPRRVPVRPPVVLAAAENAPAKGVPRDLPLPARRTFFDRLLGRPDPRPAREAAWARRVAFSPDNDELLFAFADWLEACGEPQGQMIRLHTRAERQAQEDEFSEDARTDEMMARVEKHFVPHMNRWLEPLRKLGLQPWFGEIWSPLSWFHRGLLDQVTIDRHDILPSQAERLFAAAPALQRIVVNGLWYRPGKEAVSWKPDPTRMFWVPQTRQIHTIDLSALAMSEDQVCSLGDVPYLTGLRSLTMGNTEYGIEGTRALSRSTSLTNLRELVLHSWDMGEEGTQVLAASSLLARLTTLDLVGAHIGPGGVAALLNSPRLGPLQQLRLAHNRVTDDGAALLARSEALSGVRWLDLGVAHLTTRGAEAIASSPVFARLTRLVLRRNRLDCDSLLALARSPHLLRLRFLDLEANQIGDRGARALAESGSIRKLHTLLLASNQLGDSAARDFADSDNLRWLHKLDLGQNRVGPDGAADLAESSRFDRLQELILAGNPIGLAGALALARSRSLRRLRLLHVSPRDVGHEGMRILRDRFGSALFDLEVNPPDDGKTPTIDELLGG